MTLTKNELRQLITEEIDRQHLKQIIAEDMGDWNPLEILRTAGKYYLDLAKSDNPRQQFRKDLKDAGVDDILQGVSAVPFIGLPFGLASIGLNLAAGNTRKALIQVVATAGAAVGAKAVGAGFSQAAANPRVLQAAARILNSVSQRMGGLPAIGPNITAATRSLGKNLAEAMADIAENAAENEIADAVENSKAITVAVNKLSKSQAAKKIKGPKSQKVGGGSEKMYKVGGGFAANRKDSSLTNELYSNTEDSLREVRTVKISRSRIRKLVKESIKKSGIVLGERKGDAGGVTAQGELVLRRSDLIKLAAGKSLEIMQTRKMIDANQRIRVKLIGGKATIATLMKSKKLNVGTAVFDKSVLEIKTDLGPSKAQPETARFSAGNRGQIDYESQGNKAVLKIPKEFAGLEGDEEKQVSRTQEVEPIIFAVDFQTVDVSHGGESSFK
jgi:hypothetical protein